MERAVAVDSNVTAVAKAWRYHFRRYVMDALHIVIEITK